MYGMIDRKTSTWRVVAYAKILPVAATGIKERTP